MGKYGLAGVALFLLVSLSVSAQGAREGDLAPPRSMPGGASANPPAPVPAPAQSKPMPVESAPEPAPQKVLPPKTQPTNQPRVAVSKRNNSSGQRVPAFWIVLPVKR